MEEICQAMVETAEISAGVKVRASRFWTTMTPMGFLRSKKGTPRKESTFSSLVWRKYL